MSSSKSNPKSNNKSNWKGLLLWLLLALFLRWQIIEPRWIPSGSMLPTLEIKERILIEKITPKINRVFGNESKNNQIVVFNPPKALIDVGFEANSALIKRVIGIPGDKLEVREGQLIRNGIKLKEPWIEEPINYEMDLIIVPKNSYWVLGDNRNNSLDSHLWGALPKEKLIGRAIFRYWPINKIGII